MYESEMGLQRCEGWPHDEVDGRCRVSRLCSDGRHSHGDAEDGLGTSRTACAVDEDYSTSSVWLEAGGNCVVSLPSQGERRARPLISPY